MRGNFTEHLFFLVRMQQSKFLIVTQLVVFAFEIAVFLSYEYHYVHYYTIPCRQLCQ